MFIIFSVFYILIAAAMIVLILIQRGDGANAGSGFGGGASGTVFGARGSTSFLSRSTAVLAGLFFMLSLGMAIYLHKTGNPHPGSDLGVMAGVQTPAAAVVKPAAVSDVPKADGNNSDVPKAATPTATASTAVPAAPAAAPASDGKPAGKLEGKPEPAKN